MEGIRFWTFAFQFLLLSTILLQPSSSLWSESTAVLQPINSRLGFYSMFQYDSLDHVYDHDGVNGIINKFLMGRDSASSVQLLNIICEASLKQETKEEQEEVRKAKRSRRKVWEYSENNIGLNSGTTDIPGGIDGMDHVLAGEGEPMAREFSHDMNEASAELVLH